MNLLCPICKVGLSNQQTQANELTCPQCLRKFEVSNGIPLLYWPTEDTNVDNVSEMVKAFYEETPFPNYNETDTVTRLIEKAERSIFPKLLEEQIPEDASILEVGCGTGQLSNYLAISGRQVYGADMCLNSLTLGCNFSVDQKINSVKFVQMNLFRTIFSEGQFDVVICNGVLHHTLDPYGGFKSISKLVKPGGYVVIGLYNKIGRFWTNLRRGIFRMSNNRFKFLDSYLTRSDVDDIKKMTWFKDQYQHPHELSHTYDEVMEWFEKNDFDFVNAIPKPNIFAKFSEFESLFEETPKGSSFDHLLVQLKLAMTGAEEGGFFVMVGRSRKDNKPKTE